MKEKTKQKKEDAQSAELKEISVETASQANRILELSPGANKTWPGAVKKSDHCK